MIVANFRMTEEVLKLAREKVIEVPG